MRYNHTDKAKKLISKALKKQVRKHDYTMHNKIWALHRIRKEYLNDKS